MPLKIIRASISEIYVEAIVNPTDEYYSGSGSIDFIVHTYGKNKLKKELSKKPKLSVSEASITKAYNMKCEKIIHVVGPTWIDGFHDEQKLLEDSYKNCLKIVKEYNIKSVAFPLISTGEFKFPKELGLQIATTIFTNFLLQEEVDIYLVVYDKTSFAVSKKVFSDILEYIDDNFLDKRYNYSIRRDRNRNTYDEDVSFSNADINYNCSFSLSQDCDINNIFIEDTFSVKLLSIIDKKQLTDPEVYKKANIDRKLFSKIRSNINYNPSKKTAIALSIALELNYEDTQDLLARAGFTLSKSNRFDVVIEACIKKHIYNIFDINNILFTLDLPLLD